MGGVAAEGGGKARLLGKLAIRVVCFKDGVLGVGDVGIDTGEPNGEDRSWFGDAGVIEINEAVHAYPGEGIEGDQGGSHISFAWCAKGRGRSKGADKGSGDEDAGGWQETHG